MQLPILFLLPIVVSSALLGLPRANTPHAAIRCSNAS
jgi:hypothetical protein